MGWGGLSRLVLVRPGGRSGAGQGETKPGEGAGEVVCPRPGGVDTQVEAPGVVGEAGSDVQQPLAQRLGLGASEGAVEAEVAGPGEQALGNLGEGKPGLVAGGLEGQVGEPGVLPGPDAVLDPGVLAMAQLERVGKRV